MSLRYILFDLDGTLLPMDQDVFVKAYFGGLAKHMIPYGYDPEALVQTIWKSTGAMIKNDGSRTNEEAFWDAFTDVYGKDARNCEPIFYRFYVESFPDLRKSCGYNPEVPGLIRKLKEMGFTLALATNPIFPSIATETRMQWAGLEQSDFALFTTYENSSFCKPNPLYYQEVLDKLGAKPEECLMVGNDAVEDVAAQKLGIPVFLLTECLINKHGADISAYPHGDIAALLQYIQSM